MFLSPGRITTVLWVPDSKHPIPLGLSQVLNELSIFGFLYIPSSLFRSNRYDFFSRITRRLKVILTNGFWRYMVMKVRVSYSKK